jgi:hypothetical protein
MSDWQSGPSAEQLQAFQQLSPEAVRTYLSSQGWRPHQPAHHADLWLLTEDTDEFEVLVPTDREPRDFPLRMYDVLRTLAAVQDRPLPAILADLANTGSDRMIFRLLPPGAPGTIPLLSGVDAVQGVRELVMSAAYASTLGRPLLVQGRRPQHVQDFAAGVRLGTPQAGSWVVAAEVAIPEGDLDLFGSGGPPFARQVSLQLHRGVQATLTAAGEALRQDSVEPFLTRAEDGVSANLCEALASLGRDDTPFEVRFAWAQRLPPPVSEGLFQFDRQLIRTIRSAGKELRIALLVGMVEITGLVTRLRQERGGEGTATVTGLLRSRYGEAEQAVKVRLTPLQHEAAIEAYRTHRFVRVTGEARHGRVDIVRQVEVVEPSGHTDNDG